MKILDIDIPIFFGKLRITQSKGWKKINKKYSHLWPSPMNDSAEACVFPVFENNHHIVVASFRKKPTRKVIVHECTHLVNLLFEHRGIKLDTDNDETQAYLTGWFYEQIEQFFYK